VCRKKKTIQNKLQSIMKKEKSRTIEREKKLDENAEIN